MEAYLPFLIGILYATGIYSILRRSLLKLVIGVGLLSNATHLLILTAGGLTRGRPPLVPDGETTLTAPFADPLPQALILTAIVISFGVTAYLLAVVRRTADETGTDDPDVLTRTDHLGDPLEVSK